MCAMTADRSLRAGVERLRDEAAASLRLMDRDEDEGFYAALNSMTRALDVCLLAAGPIPTCGTCAKHCVRELVGAGERYSFCDVLGQLPDELPDDFRCNQWASAAAPEGKE